MAEHKLPAISLDGLSGGNSAPSHDPLLHPELYDGVALRRVLAFCLDMLILGTVLAIAWTAALALLVLSLGLIAVPMALGSLVLVVLYDVMTVGGPASATPGMQVFGLKTINWAGGRPDNVQALLMSIVFWALFVPTSGLAAAVALFNPRWRCAHDFLSGIVVIRRT